MKAFYCTEYAFYCTEYAFYCTKFASFAQLCIKMPPFRNAQLLLKCCQKNAFRFSEFLLDK